jgi:methionyl-tRNA synthetase
MVMQHFDGIIPEADYSGAEEKALKKTMVDAEARFIEAVDRVDPNQAIDAALSVARETNRYFDRSAPWILAKEKQFERLGIVLGSSLEAVSTAAIYLSPVLPNKIPQALRGLGLLDQEITDRIGKGKSIATLAGRQITSTKPLFPRRDKVKPQIQPEKKEMKDAEPTITIDQFAAVKLKTAEVIAAEKVEKTDKLLKLQIRLGEETRQIVAGIAEFYKPEELVGRTIIVVANLQPAKVRGIESNGMLLAVQDDRALRLLTADGEIASGISAS